MTLWQKILRTNIRSVAQLCDFLELQPSQRKIVAEKTHFKINLPLRLAQKMEKGSITDPLFLQFVSQDKEFLPHDGYKQDPVEDCAFTKGDKLLVKYSGRALLLTSGACAMHCRYCFRQHFAYDSSKEFTEELAYIANDLSIKEVILSGGDPLSLSNRRLQDLLQKIEAMAHVTRIRFHSRFLMGIPERIDEPFLDLFRNSRLQFYFVLHTNHPKEWDEEIIAAIKKIQREGVVVLNQAVLLRGVNDTIETLEALAEKCIDHGVLPYYLHQLDPVEGGAHFGVDREHGKALIEALRTRTSGFGIFRYVQEEPHRQSKSII